MKTVINYMIKVNCLLSKIKRLDDVGYLFGTLTVTKWPMFEKYTYMTYGMFSLTVM